MSQKFFHKFDSLQYLSIFHCKMHHCDEITAFYQLLQNRPTKTVFGEIDCCFYQIDLIYVNLHLVKPFQKLNHCLHPCTCLTKQNNFICEHKISVQQ